MAFEIENGVLKKYTEEDGVTEVVIPDSVTSIRYEAFYWCSSLTSIVIPDSVTSIGERAFYKCSSLASIVIPDSVTSIGDYAFSGCSSLTSVVIPDSVTNIGKDILNNTGWLAQQTGDFVINGKLLYKYNGNDNNAIVPDGITVIGAGAFYECSSLTSVVIPDSVTSIGKEAFDSCDNLKEVHINNLEAWCNIIFGGWGSNPLKYAHDLYLNGEKITELVIPDSVTSIGNYAFRSCSSLTSVVIPDSVTSIGVDAFEYCNGLKEVHINNLEAWCKIEFENYSSHPLTYAHDLYLNGEKITELVIPDSVTSIRDRAFSGCSSLTSVVIPDIVTIIGDWAFEYCSSLTSVVIPVSVTSIGRRAFGGCSSLTSIVIPDSVTSIGGHAFSGCSNLTSIVLSDSVTSIEEGAFADCSSLTSVVIPDSVTSIEESAFSDCSSLTSVVIPDSVTSIGDDAFRGCNSLISIFKLNNVSYLGSNVFENNNLQLDTEFLTNKLENDFLLNILDSCTDENKITIYLFQSGAKVQKATAPVLLNDPNAAVVEIARQLRLMPKKFSKKVCNKIIYFAIEYRDAIGKREFNELYKAMSDKDAGATKVMITSAAQLEDHLYPEDELDTVETKTVNHPSEQLCLDNIDMEEVDKTIRNDCGYIYSLVESYLSKNTLCYKGTDIPVADYVLKCIIVCPYMDKFVDTVKEIGKTIDPAGFMEFIRYISQINRDIINLYQNPELLDVLYLFGDNELVESLIKLNSKWGEWSEYNKAGREARYHALDAVYRSDTFAAMNYCEKRGGLGRYAEMRGMDEQTFRDTVLDNFDLDDNYEKVYDIGYEVRVSLNADLTFSIFNSAQNKYVKSFPKKSDDPEKRDKCAEDFSILSKNIKKCINKRKDILWKNCLKEKYLEANIWTRAYLGNPVLRRVAETIVWKLSEFDGEEITGTKFFVMKGKALSDIDGNAVNIPENGKICPAHITDLSKEDAEQWSAYFKENKIEQAFEQLDEVCIEDLEEIDVNERYSGKDLEIFMLQGLKSRGFSYGSEVLERGKYGVAIDIEHSAWLMGFGISIHTSDGFNSSISELTIVDRNDITTKVKNYVVNVMDYTMAYNCCYNDNAEDLKMYLPNFSRSYLEKLLKYCNEHQKLNCLPVLMDYKHTCYGEDDLSSDEYEL